MSQLDLIATSTFGLEAVVVVSSDREVREGSEQHGAIAIWAAVGMPMILGIGALAFDMNSMYVTKSQLQHTADASAIAAA